MAVVLSKVSEVFMVASWADFIIDFRKVFLTSLVMFIAALEVAFVSAIMRSPIIVIVVSSLFF